MQVPPAPPKIAGTMNRHMETAMNQRPASPLILTYLGVAPAIKGAPRFSGQGSAVQIVWCPVTLWD